MSRSEARTIVITGAAGHLGKKLRGHLGTRYRLRLIDHAPDGDGDVMQADLQRWDPRWADVFRGADVIVHLAAQADPSASWADLIGPNLDATIHTFHAAALAGVGRIVYASSSHVLGGYMDDDPIPRLDASAVPRPGAHGRLPDGTLVESKAYGATKLFGERLGRCHAEHHRMTVIALRIGRILPGQNDPRTLDPSVPSWSRLMWLSNRDYGHLMDRAIAAELGPGFFVIHGVSRNAGTPWDLAEARQLIGYEPEDDITAL